MVSNKNIMKYIITALALMLGACASRRPSPYSYTIISHYGYDNPNHTRLSIGAVPQAPVAPPVHPLNRPFFDTYR